MNEQIVVNILKFMARSQIQGAEASAYLQCQYALQKLLEELQNNCHVQESSSTDE